MTDAPLSALLVMLKPDGDLRTCTSDELRRLRDGWNDLLAWLRGTDPDDLSHADLVGAVAQKAGLRMVRFAEYDVRSWARQAVALINSGTPDLPSNDGTPLQEVISARLTNLGFTREGATRSWLNRVTIELLYRDAPKFDDNRELLVGHLLKGPVTIQHWRGEHHGLALALKLLTRRALSSAQLTNLVHIESVTTGELELIGKSLEVKL
ncbi:MAG TPA: hypothetical protein DGG94_03245 [Micromonosporaceae bacterium]|nr:hypothetical protein [Micromonosporaceae bacterium]HCU48830.1 hypothetical protein [Micromonosporaceae bacterium]